METYHILINGIVQGVGFRPMVYNLACGLNLNGYVKNGSDGLNIFVNASTAEVEHLMERIKAEAPDRSTIVSIQAFKIANRVFNGFSILVEERERSNRQVLLSPDIALCPSCRAELHDGRNHRYRYPFITCTQCGPRYSIINKLPYERHNTTMHIFKMCNECQDEYSDVADRRFFSQTNSCDDCGVSLSLHRKGETPISSETEVVLNFIKSYLDLGKIIAVKGIGGYVLMCDAQNKAAIETLRGRKHRPAKPFAVLYPGIEAVSESFDLSDCEKELLLSPESPIVLLNPKPATAQQIAIETIAPGLNTVGVMVPYNPLFELIATDFGKPLIATSANLSGSPIIYHDGDALNCLFDMADYIVSHNREIVIPQDDSVVRVAKHCRQPVMMRRSRGYAPSFVGYTAKSNQCILSMGALLKSSFTLAANGNVFVSQFLGNGESFESQLMYKQTLEHWLAMYVVTPTLIVADRHPDYFTNLYGRELAQQYHTELKFVQHHEAHFAAILAESHLICSTSPILGVIWDGTGLGDDGNIWGGEFFIYDTKTIARSFHFDYIPSVAGDKTALEPRIAALCASFNVSPNSALLEAKFTTAEWNNYHSLIHSAGIFTSSVGRLFDAVASLLGLCDKQSYEGEAAIYLQCLAESYVEQHGFVIDQPYFDGELHHYRIPTASIIRGILIDIESGVDIAAIAAKFHYSLVCIIGTVAHKLHIKQICFSGGVFQNTLLVDWIKAKYADSYELFFHVRLTPNDENISFGQMVYVDNGFTSLTNESILPAEEALTPNSDAITPELNNYLL